jgi:hypothetical protein
MTILVAPLIANRQMAPASANSSQPVKQAKPPSPLPSVPESSFGSPRLDWIDLERHTPFRGGFGRLAQLFQDRAPLGNPSDRKTATLA